MAYRKGHRGALPKYTSADEITGLIDNYFESCKGHPLMVTDDTGREVPYLDKRGNPIIIDQHPPTVTGLALALGFESRQSLLNYQCKPEFSSVITRAKSRIEQYTEERLFDKDGANGAKFSLELNWGWGREKQQSSEDSPVVKIICDIPKDAPIRAEQGDGGDADNSDAATQ